MVELEGTQTSKDTEVPELCKLVLISQALEGISAQGQKEAGDDVVWWPLD